MRIALYALAAVLVGALTAVAGDCRRATVVEKIVVQDEYVAPVTVVEKVVVQPAHVQRIVVQQPVVVQQKVVRQNVVRQNVYGGYGGGNFRSAQFVGGGRQRLVGGGGGGGLGGIINAIGNVANSPAGTFVLGALAGGGSFR